jgi:HEAT repeat protein
MNPIFSPLFLTLGLLAGPDLDNMPASTEPAQLREALLDRQQPRAQSQAALLLLTHGAPEAEDIVREGLRQTDAVEVFTALAAAVRLYQDVRFVDELLQALPSHRPAIRQAAAETLAALADPALVRRLQALIEDVKTELSVRQTALWILGRSGRKQAAIVLFDQLSSEHETVQQAAAEALADLTGMNYGVDRNRWRSWWEKHRDLSNERWLEQRLSYQTTRSRRLEGDVERLRSQVVRLNQQLYSRLPAVDRLGHIQSVAEQDDPAVRQLAVNWSVEMLATFNARPGSDAGPDTLTQRTLSEVLLRLSHDGHPEVQCLAVLALGRLPDPAAFERLRVLLKRGRASVRAAAARALAQQAHGSGPEAQERQKQVVPALQKALDDPALEVVVEAAENLGALGVPEAAPVLVNLLKHPSEHVRQTAVQALERVSDTTVLEGLLAALEEPAVTVRFSLVGAIGHAAGDGKALTEVQRERLLTALQDLLAKDIDPGVRSRAATVLGECGQPTVLTSLWQRVTTTEDSRVQEKAWAALVEIIVRQTNIDLLREWDRTLAASRQSSRRLQLLTEVSSRWQRKEELRAQATAAAELLVPAQLEHGKWNAAFLLLREMLARATTDVEIQRRMRWLLVVGELALNDGNLTEARRAVHEAQPYLTRAGRLAAEFDRLEKKIRAKE